MQAVIRLITGGRAPPCNDMRIAFVLAEQEGNMAKILACELGKDHYKYRHLDRNGELTDQLAFLDHALDVLERADVG